LQPRPVLQRVQRRAVGDEQAGRDIVGQAIRDRDELFERDRHALAARTPADIRGDPTPQPGRIAALAERDHPSRQFGAGREGERRLELVLVLDDETVEEVERGAHDLDDRFAGAGDGVFDLLQHERLGRSEPLAQHGLHEGIPRFSPPRRRRPPPAVGAAA
jgi:hypothetical protein